MTQNAAPKRKPGRPKKEEKAVQPEPVTMPKKEGPFIFKSKFREDVIELIKPRSEKRADGSSFIDPGFNAEFHRNTWNAPDSMKAQLMRDKINSRIAAGDPLHVVETTRLD